MSGLRPQSSRPAGASKRFVRDFDPLRLQPNFAARGIANVVINDAIRKSVLFIGTKKDGTFKPAATGFFVLFEDHGLLFTYLVTADHVVSNLLGTGEEIWLRTNRKDGSIQEDQLNAAPWIFFDEREKTDVCISPVVFSPDEDVILIPINGKNSLIASKDKISENVFGVGEEIAIVGLFKSHYGVNKNIPIVRIGNIATMPEEPISTGEYGYVEAYLVEARSIGGLSGSPVFINMPPMRFQGGNSVPTQGRRFYLLGLMHGHFDIRDLNSDAVTDKLADAAGDINTGIGVVIPAWKILELIMYPELVKQRKEGADFHSAATGATPDSQVTDDPRGV